MGDWARRAQSIGEWPGFSVTSLEGFLGMEEWVGGGARVDDPGWRFGAERRERFGVERSDEEEEMVVVVVVAVAVLGIGARVGMRRGAGTGGGAMREGVREFEFVLDTVGGGGIIVVGVGVEVEVESCCVRIAGSWVVDGSDRVKLGTASSSLFVAGALGVGWSSSGSSSSCSFFASSCWVSSIASGCLSLAPLFPLAPASLSRGPGIDLWWRRLAKKLGSHAGRRKQNKTTDATMRETPIRAMVGLEQREPSVTGAWEGYKCGC